MNDYPLVNVYCDESCHVLHDHNTVMGLGAVSAPASRTRQFSLGLREIMDRHNCRGELKWGKVSTSKLSFYFDIIEWFFSVPDLQFRALVIKDKSILHHEDFDGDHDEFYYKMYYYLLRPYLERKPPVRLRAFLDVKDTHGAVRIHKLAEVLANTFYDFDHDRVGKIQEVRSRDARLVQVADFLLGAVTYSARGLTSSPAKIAVIARLRELSGYDLTETTELWATKFNLLFWKPSQDLPNA